MKPDFRYTIVITILTCLGVLLSACRPDTSTAIPTLTFSVSPNATATLTQVPTPTLTPTPEQPAAVLLAVPGSDPSLVGSLQAGLNDIVTNAGLRWQVRQQLSPDDLITDLKLVVAIPPDPGLAMLAASAPETQFLALGIPGLEPAPNLTSIGGDGDRPDEQGFIAGVIAAMLSADWRAGVISLSDTAEGRSARSGFLNGVEYFCGLCRPLHPPYYEYPLYIELPSTATSAEWQEAANYMVDHYAQTVYVHPGAGDEAMLSILTQADVSIISSGEPPQAVHTAWVLSLTTDPLPFIQNQVKGILDGSITGGDSLELPIQFTKINQDIFSPGKQRLAQQILSDLQAGNIDTGVDLSTGEFRP